MNRIAFDYACYLLLVVYDIASMSVWRSSIVKHSEIACEQVGSPCNGSLFFKIELPSCSWIKLFIRIFERLALVRPGIELFLALSFCSKMCFITVSK